MLPRELNPKRLSTKSQNDITAFYSIDSPLSNFFPSKFTVNDEKFNCGEQFLTVTKARLFGDTELVDKLFGTESPLEQKRLAKSVNNYSHKTWLKKSEELVYEGIFQKFSQSRYLKRFLLKTDKTYIVEASLDKEWGAGVALHNENIWDINKHSGGNKLGHILMKVRESLKTHQSTTV